MASVRVCGRSSGTHERLAAAKECHELRPNVLCERSTVARDVDFVRERQLHELPHPIRLWGAHRARVAIAKPEMPVNETSVGELTIATRIKVHEVLGGRTDRACQTCALGEVEQGLIETIGSVGRVAEAGDNQRLRSTPSGQQIGGPAKVGQERAPRMGDLRSAGRVQ